MALIPAGNTEGIMILSVGTVFALLAVIAFGLRIWAHQIQKVALNWSDYFCAAGLIFALALLGVTVDLVVQGLGLDVTQVTPQRLVKFEKCLIAGTFLWIVSNTCIRIAVLLLYIQIFQTRRFRLACYIVLGFNLVYVLVVILSSSLICRPFALQWDQSLKGSCGDTKSFYLFLPIFNLFEDLVIVVLPLPILWGLQMPRSKKVALSAIFGVGIGICVITFFRIIETVRADLHNPTGGDGVFGLLGLLEPFLGVMDSCLPLLGPIKEKIAASKMFAGTKGDIRQSRIWENGRAMHRNESTAAYAKRFKRLDDTVDLELEGMSVTEYVANVSRGSQLEDNDTWSTAKVMAKNSKRSDRSIVVRQDLDIHTSK